MIYYMCPTRGRACSVDCSKMKWILTRLGSSLRLYDTSDSLTDAYKDRKDPSRGSAE
jgi:hypothetical protein